MRKELCGMQWPDIGSTPLKVRIVRPPLTLR
jgi:hypothetical protein